MTLDNIGHGLGVDGMDQPEQGAERGSQPGIFQVIPLSGKNPLQEEKNAEPGNDMKNEIDQVVGESVLVAEIQIEREAQIGQKTILPEILQSRGKEERRTKRADPKVRIVNDAGLVIEHKLGLEAGQISSQRKGREQNPD